jgi:hypothetical protein
VCSANRELTTSFSHLVRIFVTWLLGKAILEEGCGSLAAEPMALAEGGVLCNSSTERRPNDPVFEAHYSEASEWGALLQETGRRAKSVCKNAQLDTFYLARMGIRNCRPPASKASR